LVIKIVTIDCRKNVFGNFYFPLLPPFIFYNTFETIRLKTEKVQKTFRVNSNKIFTFYAVLHFIFWTFFIFGKKTFCATFCNWIIFIIIIAKKNITKFVSKQILVFFQYKKLSWKNIQPPSNYLFRCNLNFSTMPISTKIL
jgi:hypothetical protein